MDGFFHDRPSEVYLEDNTLVINYRPTPKTKGTVEKKERILSVGQIETLPEYEQRKDTQLRVQPLSTNITWGLQVICIAESGKKYSVVIQAEEKNVAVRLLKNDVLSDVLFVREHDEKVLSMMVRDDIHSSIFVNNQPVYALGICEPIHYAPIVLSGPSETATVAIEQEFFP